MSLKKAAGVLMLATVVCLGLAGSAAAAPPNDNFEDAIVLLGGTSSVDGTTVGATSQPGEPVPLNSAYGLTGTVWYSWTPTVGGSSTLSLFDISGMGACTVDVYTGGGLDSLTNIATALVYPPVWSQDFNAVAGTTYHIQVSNFYPWEQGTFMLGWAGNMRPFAEFQYSPFDPSVFDTVQLSNFSWDVDGIASWVWDLGDGVISTEWNPTHQYKADGDYTVTLTVEDPYGLTSSTSQVVQVRTHDVAITRFTAPTAASAKQTKQIVVGLASRRYVEAVNVELYKSVPGGFELVGTLTQTVPVRSANRTTDFKFTYTFTPADAAVGKVTFKAVAVLASGARDALPADNEAIAPPTKLNR